MTPTERIRVVCAVIKQGDMVFAARRPDDRTNGGLWEFPGGKVHDGETLEAALHREIREELAVGIGIHEALTPVQWDYPWIAIELFPFVCSMEPEAQPRLLDHAAVRFVSRDEIACLPWAPADQVIVERYFRD